MVVTFHCMNNLIKGKTHGTRDFFNQKNFHSLLLQVVCDSNKLFWNVYCELVDVQMVKHLNFQFYIIICKIS
jgi:hypothetical protein